MRAVIYTPYHIGIVTVVQGGTIGKGTYVLANHIRFTVVILELNPSNFLGKLAELLYQYVNISNHIIAQIYITLYFTY